MLPFKDCNMIKKFKIVLNVAYRVILTQPVCACYLYGKTILPIALPWGRIRFSPCSCLFMLLAECQAF
jgi:hypothetical protein